MRLNIQTIKDNSIELEGGNDEIHELVAKILQAKFGSFPIVLGQVDLLILEGMEIAYSVMQNIDCSLLTVIKNKLENNRIILIEFKSKG
jgi:hypothetical protein